MATYELWRYTHPDGSAKDWAVRQNADGTLTTRWGVTGTCLRNTRTRAGNARTAESVKQRKGYVFVGTVTIADDGTVLMPDRGDKAPTTAADAANVYWRIHLPDSPSAQQEMLRLREQLHAAIRNLDPAFDGRVWHGWTLPIPGRDRSGRIAPGAAGGIRALLYLMALHQRAAGSTSGIRVHLADDLGREIGSSLLQEATLLNHFGSDSEALRPLAEGLGLLPTRIDLAVAIKSDRDHWF